MTEDKIPGTAQLLDDWRGGDDSARDALIGRLLPELRQISAARLRRDENSSLSSHDLVNEAVARLLVAGDAPANRAHFLALASRLMRNILVDHARSRNAGKRRHHRTELHTRIEGEDPVDLQDLDFALVRLEAIKPELAEIVEMRFFGGLTLAEVGEAAGYSEATAKRRWHVARAWLADALES